MAGVPLAQDVVDVEDEQHAPEEGGGAHGPAGGAKSGVARQN